MDYDYEKENYKTCPVCKKVIDYHIHGFYPRQKLIMVSPLYPRTQRDIQLAQWLIPWAKRAVT